MKLPAWKEVKATLKIILGAILFGCVSIPILTESSVREDVVKAPGNALAEVRADLSGREVWEVKLSDAVERYEPYHRCINSEKCMVSMDENTEAVEALENLIEVAESIPPDTTADKLPSELREKLQQMKIL